MSGLLFVLPVGGGSGGAHSVMQEADAMWRLGMPAFIASNTDNADKLRRGYRDLETVHRNVHAYASAEDLGKIIDTLAPDAVIATTNQSVHVLAEALTAGKGRTNVRMAYYIQDYEPLFYEKDSKDWLTAFTSFGLIPGMIHFAKTQWLQEIVQKNHGVAVEKVEPSIDHAVYYPYLPFRVRSNESIAITAMLRPATPRRAPRRTMRILNRLAHEFGGRIKCTSFGCSTAELDAYSLQPQGVTHLGTLRRDEVGDLLRTTDLFLDLSDYQAFGRTAIEAMSCGAVSVVPAHGGAFEFAKDCQNSFVVDTRDDEDIMEAIRIFISMPEPDRRRMSLAAIDAGFRYTPERAALSELRLLAKGFQV
jgi:glycosyltransferase involved in cell wall biosynthesis